MTRKVEHTPEELARAKYLYEETLAPVEDIAAMLGLALARFYDRVKAGNWKRRISRRTDFTFARALIEATPSVPAAPPLGDPVARQKNLAERRLALAERKAALAESIIASAASTVEAVGAITRKLKPASNAEAERQIRNLAGVARALRECAALLTPEGEKTDNEADDDPIPRDIDAFRDELARRIRGMVDAAERRRKDGIADRTERPLA